MADLSAAAVRAWREKLPADLRAVVPDDLSGDEATLARIASKLAEADAERVPGIVLEHGEMFAAMGRARRVRFLAWLAKRAYPESGIVISALIGKESDEQGSTGRQGGGVVAPYFLEDLRAFAEALGPRVARRMVGGDAVGLIARAASRVRTSAEATPEASR